MQKTSQNFPESMPLAEINITPFVDVLLVLLAIFLVTAPLLQQGLMVHLPKVEHQKSIPVTAEATTTLTLTADYKIYLADQKIEMTSLASSLNAYFEGKKDPQVMVHADGSLPYAWVAQMLAHLKAAQVVKIGLVTETDQKPLSPPGITSHQHVTHSR